MLSTEFVKFSEGTNEPRLLPSSNERKRTNPNPKKPEQQENFQDPCTHTRAEGMSHVQIIDLQKKIRWTSAIAVTNRSPRSSFSSATKLCCQSLLGNYVEYSRKIFSTAAPLVHWTPPARARLALMQSQTTSVICGTKPDIKKQSPLVNECSIIPLMLAKIRTFLWSHSIGHVTTNSSFNTPHHY